MIQGLTKRQNELKNEIEVMDYIYSNISMDDLNYEYYIGLKDQLNMINFLITHPESL